MLGRLQKKIAMNRSREAGNNYGRHIFQRKFLFPFRRFAGQLPVPATQGALGRVDVDDVVGHDAMPVNGVLSTSIPSLINVARRTFILWPSVLFWSRTTSGEP